MICEFVPGTLSITKRARDEPVSTSSFSDMLQSIAERGRALIDRTRDRRGVAEQRSASLAQLCEDLLSGRGEASGVALAGEILSRYGELKTGPRIAFFEALARRFGADRSRLSAAASAYLTAPSDAAASNVQRASEPRRLELFRRLNLAPGGTTALVRMREQLMDAIDPILSAKRERIEPERATTAVFYSISNCQRGLAGVSFGHFLIKQVVEEVSREIPRLATFVTLSPAPNFAEWLRRERANGGSVVLGAEDRAALTGLDRTDWWREEVAADTLQQPLFGAAACYYLRARSSRGTPLDSVARFHLGNGARLERLNFLADTSERALQQSYGLMVNYLYDLEDIEQNHEAYAQQHAIVAASPVTRLLRAPARDAIPAGE